MDEGKEHIKREKRRRQRLADSAVRRREFSDRFGTGDQNEGSSPNVRQRTPIAKFASQDAELGGAIADYDGISRRENSQGLVSSPERSLLGASRSPRHTGTEPIEGIQQDRELNTFPYKG